MTVYMLNPSVAVRDLVRCLLVDRRSPEAAELFGILLRYTENRVYRVVCRRGAKLSAPDREEIVADVLLALMEGGLARFNGDSLAQLLGFVRTIADRTVWRAFRRRDAERNALMGVDADLVRDWMSKPPAPDATELHVSSPLPHNDQEYLRELLIAGGKASLSRRLNVSRAAVSQRVARIQARIAELGERWNAWPTASG